MYINLTAIGLTFMNELIGVQSFARLSLLVDFVYMQCVGESYLITLIY